MNECNLFIDGLVLAIPELTNDYQQHIDGNGELLPHVFMGDVTRFAIDQAAKSKDYQILQRLLTYLEAGIQSNSTEISELAGVSFLENLMGEDAALVTLLPMMGKALRHEAQLMDLTK
jgi:hypothetical protein